MEHFTPRELEVLRLICEGQSTRRIARQLGISVKTVACHRYRVLSKAGVRNAVGLLRWGIRQGIVHIDREDDSAPGAIHVPFRKREELAAEVDQARSQYLEASRSFLEATEDVPSGVPNPDGALRLQLPAANRREAFEAYQRARKKLADHDEGRDEPAS